MHPASTASSPSNNFLEIIQSLKTDILHEMDLKLAIMLSQNQMCQAMNWHVLAGAQNVSPAFQPGVNQLFLPMQR